MASSLSQSTLEDVRWKSVSGSVLFNERGICFVPSNQITDKVTEWLWENIASRKRGSSNSDTAVNKVKINFSTTNAPVVLTLVDRKSVQLFCEYFDRFQAITDTQQDIKNKKRMESSVTEFEGMDDFSSREYTEQRLTSPSGLSKEDQDFGGLDITESTSLMTDPLTTNSGIARSSTIRNNGASDTDCSDNNNVIGTSHCEEDFRDEPDPMMSRLNKSVRTSGNSPRKFAHDPSDNKKKTKAARIWQATSCCLLIVVVILLVCILGVAIAGFKHSSSDNKSFIDRNEAPDSGTAIDRTDPPTSVDDIPYGLCPFDVTDLDTRSENFMSTGCFGDAQSVETHRVFCSSPDLRAMECSVRCFTRLFGVTGDICKCFSQVPSDRLGIGSCMTIDRNNNNRNLRSTNSSDLLMELYVNLNTNNECQSKLTESIRNFLVGEDNAPFGFDIVQNTYRNSPFQLFNDECGTNIYEVQTDVSEDRLSRQTSVLDVTEFAEKRRSEAQLAVDASVEASGGLFVKVTGGVSASYDQQQTNLFQSSGAAEVGSKVFTSTAVRRLARVEIPDFDKRESIITFSPAFARRLKDYLDGGFQQSAAFDILNVYGQFVVTRGLFGGFMERRMTMSGSTYESLTSDESALSECFEAKVWGGASFGAGSVEASASTQSCNEEELETINESKSQFDSETNEQSTFGGTVECVEGVEEGSLSCDLRVKAETSRLLTTKDKYPAGDSGIQLMPLTAFLEPSKVSPLEVKRWHISENDFARIKQKLEQHTEDYFTIVRTSLNLCNCSATDIPYLTSDPFNLDGGKPCECYSPEMPKPTPAPTSSPTIDPARCNATGISSANIINSQNDPTVAGSRMGDDFCKNVFFGIGCGANSGWDRFQRYQRTQGEWFKATVLDASSCTGTLEHRVLLQVPEGVDYSMTIYKGFPSDASLYQNSTTDFASGSKTIDVVVRGGDGGGSDPFDYYVLVEHADGGSCEPYTIELFNHEC